MFKIVDTDFEPAKYLPNPVAMADHFEAMLMGFIDDGLCRFQRHFIMIDEFDDIDTRFCEHLDFPARLGWRFYAPAKGIRSGVDLVLDEGA